VGSSFRGTSPSDRWRGYDYLDPNQRQLCWAHLLRDFTAHSEGMAEQAAFGQAGLVIAHDLFAAWDSYQQHGDRACLQVQMDDPQYKQVKDLRYSITSRGQAVIAPEFTPAGSS
jgi:hypothetical protein